jgi:hypothetical protein
VIWENAMFEYGVQNLLSFYFPKISPLKQCANYMGRLIQRPANPHTAKKKIFGNTGHQLLTILKHEA